MSLSPGSTSSGTPCSSLAVVYDQLSAFLSFEREREGREGREGLGYRVGQGRVVRGHQGQRQTGPSNFVSLDFERLPGQQSNPALPCLDPFALLTLPAISDSCSMDITLPYRVVVLRFILFSFFLCFFFFLWYFACCPRFTAFPLSLPLSFYLPFGLLSCSFNDNLCWLVLSSYSSSHHSLLSLHRLIWKLSIFIYSLPVSHFQRGACQLRS